VSTKKLTIKTNKGVIKAEIDLDRAPITAGNFADLVGRNFYDGLLFHRYEPRFVIQGGDPRGNGTGGFIEEATGRERRIKLEIHPELRHDRAGTLAMARSFYITLAPTPFLDDNYAVFGYVTEGLDVVQEVRKGDKIESIRFDE
jgi:peptidyl-prolyl cis-trans isomerase B (cyclophilin B)